jgi:hypothetical protein
LLALPKGEMEFLRNVIIYRLDILLYGIALWLFWSWHDHDLSDHLCTSSAVKHAMLSKDVQSYNIPPFRKACTEIRIKQSHLPTVSHACQVLSGHTMHNPPANTAPVASDLYTMLALGVTAKIVATCCYTARLLHCSDL